MAAAGVPSVPTRSDARPPVAARDEGRPDDAALAALFVDYRYSGDPRYAGRWCRRLSNVAVDADRMSGDSGWRSTSGWPATALGASGSGGADRGPAPGRPAGPAQGHRPLRSRLRDQVPHLAMPTVLGELRRHFRDPTWEVRVPRRAKELHHDVRRQ